MIGVIKDWDIVNRLGDIRVPALVISGRPDGKPLGVWLFPTKSGGARQLMAGPVGDVGFVDAGHVYIVSTADRSTDASNPLPQVRVLDAQSGEITDSTPLPAQVLASASFSVSGRWLAFASSSTPQCYIASRAGKNA